MARVLVPLAPGFEEIEAVTIIDILRRANVEVTVAGTIAGPVKGSHGVLVVPDTTIDAVASALFDMVVLPGGGEGTANLRRDPRIASLVKRQSSRPRRSCTAEIARMRDSESLSASSIDL